MPRFGLVLTISCVVALWSRGAVPLSLSLDFSLDRQTYNWSDSLSLTRQLNSSLKIQLRNRSTATLIRKSVFGEGADRWQKTARSGASLTYQIKPRISGGVEVEQDFDRLEKKRFIGNRLYLFGGIEGRHFAVSQRGGLVWEERLFEPARNTQTGWGHSALISWLPKTDLSLGKARVETEMAGLSRTPHKGVTFSYDLSRHSSKGDTVTLTALQSFGQKTYFPASGNFQTTARQESEQRRWDFHAARLLPAKLAFTANAAYRFDSYHYSYDESVLDFARQNDNFTALLEYQLSLSRRFGSTLFLLGTYLFNRTKEDFGTQQTNQRAETGQIALTARVNFLEADTLELIGQTGVTSYFAPTSSTFFADRDRSVNVASLRITHRFSSFLTGIVDGSYRGFHTIYISGTLSANNNINNVYIFNPTLLWRPFDRVTLQQNYQMYANYIYYEYEKSDLVGRNTLYRRANVVNKLTISLSPRTDFIFEHSYRYEDFGRLAYSDQWQQQVSWDRRTHRPRFGVDYRPTPRFRFQPYAAYEVQKSYDHLFDPNNTLGRRQQSEKFTRKVIGFDLEWTLSQDSHVDCRLQRRVQDYQNQRNQEYDLFTISVKRRL